MSAPYSTRYYDSIKEDSAASARETVPIITALFSPASVVDVGCGSGTWTHAYSQFNAQILGIDGFQVAPSQLLIPAQSFQRRDLSQPLQLNRRFDLAHCLEVAEHLPPARAVSFVHDLCQLADVVVFSAAVPGQGGTHHINEQWPSFWIPLFQKEGFQPLDCLRHQLWNNPSVAWWYAQNIFAFIKENRISDFPKAVAASRPWPTDLVHPRAYVRATVPSEMSPRMLKEVLLALPHFPKKVWNHFRPPPSS